MVVKNSGVKVGNKVTFHGLPIIKKHPKSNITIGENSVICSDSLKTDLGVNHPVILNTMSADAFINIGKNVGISGASICALGGVIIGDDCLIGANVLIFDNDFHTLDPKERNNKEIIKAKNVIIHENVFIGANSLILKGVTIGSNSVIGAGSVVTKNVPQNSIYSGNPAKLINLLD